MTRLTRPLAAAALTVLLFAPLTACGGNGYKQGPAGTVVDKHRRVVAKVTRYYLTTRDANGIETKFRTSDDDYDDYDACYHGSAYPRCTEVR